MKKVTLLLVLSLIVMLSVGAAYAQTSPTATPDCVLDLAPECPATRVMVQVTMQAFERGFMVYRSDTREIYVLGQYGDFHSFVDTWDGEALPQEIPPSEGVQQPQMGFGNLWLTNEDVRMMLDWATSDEATYTSVIETTATDSPTSGSITYLRSVEGYIITLNYYNHTWDYIYTEVFGPVAVIRESFTSARVGPAENFFAYGILYDGQRYPIVGQDSTGTWWQIEYYDDKLLWVEQSNITVANVENVPIVETEPCVNDMSTTCPVTLRTTEMIMQTFEHGLMLLVHDNDWIYVLNDNGYFEGFADEWAGESFTPQMAPTGLQQPTRSFGFLWQTHGYMSESLGWATADEITFSTTFEISDGTSWAPSDDATYIPLPDGRAVGIRWYSGRWSFLEETQ